MTDSVRAALVEAREMLVLCPVYEKYRSRADCQSPDFVTDMVAWRLAARADIARREAGAMLEAGLRKAMDIILECPDGTCPVDVFRCVQRELSAARAAALQGESK